MQPPPGFEFVRVGGSTVLVDAARRESYLLEGLSRPTVLVSTARPRAGGRGGALDLTIAGEEVVLRKLRRGGLVRLLLRDRTWSRDRAFLEVAALVAARERGVPAVQPVAAVATPAGLGLHRQLLLTLMVPGARDLLQALGPGVKHYAERALVVRAAAAAVKEGFVKGLDPPDLHPRNLLLTEAVEPQCLWVDLDRAVVRPGAIPPATRVAALARFVRYTETHRGDGGAAMSRSELLRFVKGVEGDDWKRSARAIWARVARARRIHRIGALWRPGAASSSMSVRSALPRRGPETPVAPAVSVVFAPGRQGEARRVLELFLGVAETAGLRSFEIVGAARAQSALDDLRVLSALAPALRFHGTVKQDDGAAWRALFQSARGPRVLVLEPGALDAGFLTEALERLNESSDVVAGVRGGESDGRGSLTRWADNARNLLARVFQRAPVRDASATFLARNDDRFQAAVRAMRSHRQGRAELLGRLAESGARFAEVRVAARSRS